MKSQSLNLNQALASGRLQEFVRHEEARGAELTKGSDFERALALLITKRRTGGAQTTVVIDGFEHPGARAF